MIIETYSVLLLTTCGAAVACGLYAVHGSVTRLNRLFLAICATLAVWAFGLALTGAARTEEICSVGRRIVEEVLRRCPNFGRRVIRQVDEKESSVREQTDRSGNEG